MLLNNGTWFGRLRPTGGMGVIPSPLLNSSRAIKLYENARFGQKVSVPQGYQSAERAIVPSLVTSDFISAQMVGEGNLVNTQVRIAQSMSATITGDSFVNPNAEVGKTMWATITGEGSLLGDARMQVSMSAVIDAGARPSAFDIAQEVWQSQKTSYNGTGTMGNALNNASSGGVDYAALGAAVWEHATRTLTSGGPGGATAEEIWEYVNRTLTTSAPTAEQNAAAVVAAATATPLAVNIKQVNNVSVKGSGTAGDPWNPV